METVISGREGSPGDQRVFYEDCRIDDFGQSLQIQHLSTVCAFQYNQSWNLQKQNQYRLC
jgi:hypothetical protein